MKNLIYFWLLLSAILFVSKIETQGQKKLLDRKQQMAKAGAVDKFIRAQMKQFHIPGLSLVIVRNGKITKAEGYGFANVELNSPATPDTVYEIGSITKQFTSTAIMMLVEENKIKLDDKIESYLPDIPENWKLVTVRQLLNQTSGLKDYYADEPDFISEAHLPTTKEQILKSIFNAPLLFKPGESYNYSNTNHFLLGLIIERSSGKTYADYLQERIFTPLNITATRFNNHKIIIPNRARGYNYDWSNNVLQNADYVDSTWSSAAGALVSSVNDLAKWDVALETEKLVRTDSKKQMWKAGRLNSGISHRYGFGWYVDKVNGHLNLSHGGDIPGFATYVSRYPDDRLTVILSLNQYIYPKRIADKIAAMFLPELIYRPIPDDEPKFTALVQNLYVDRATGKSDLWSEQLFAPELWKWLQVALANPNEIDFYKQLGATRSVTLVERIKDERGLLLRYRLSYERSARLVKFVRDGTGKITEWEDYEE